MERFMKCPISMNLAFPANRLGKKTLKNGSRNSVPGVNIVFLKIPASPEPNGLQIFKIHIFAEFSLKKLSYAPVIF